MSSKCDFCDSPAKHAMEYTGNKTYSCHCKNTLYPHDINYCTFDCLRTNVSINPFTLSINIGLKCDECTEITKVDADYRGLSIA